jgi:hypothetical protein
MWVLRKGWFTVVPESWKGLSFIGAVSISIHAFAVEMLNVVEPEMRVAAGRPNSIKRTPLSRVSCNCKYMSQAGRDNRLRFSLYRPGDFSMMWMC